VGTKDDLEVALCDQLQTLCEVQVELALCKITSTYFEGYGPQARQVVLGRVLIDGWLIAHRVFAGNRKDATTVDEVVQKLKERFGLHRIVFVGERGMTDSTVREVLEAAGCGCLVGLPRRRNPEVEARLAEARWTPLEQWEPVPATQAAAAGALIPSVACCRRHPCLGRHRQQTKPGHGDCRRHRIKSCSLPIRYGAIRFKTATSQRIDPTNNSAGARAGSGLGAAAAHAGAALAGGRAGPVGEARRYARCRRCGWWNSRLSRAGGSAW